LEEREREREREIISYTKRRIYATGYETLIYIKMTWCNNFEEGSGRIIDKNLGSNDPRVCKKPHVNLVKTCPACGHQIHCEVQVPSQFENYLSIYAN
jgi:hypothetical protein